MKFIRMNMIVTLLAIVLTAGVAFARPTSTTVNDVRYTVHNLSNNSNLDDGLAALGRNYSASNTGANQVCIFCHTPHNASPAIPLWNKVYAAGLENTYRLYTSSSTLTPTAKAAKITANSESLLCLSCHDGKTAINVLHNSSYRDATTAGGDAVIYIDGTFSASGGVFSLGDQWQSPLSQNRANLGAVRNATGIPTKAASLDGTNLTDDHPIGFSYTAAQGEDTAGLKAVPSAGIRLFGPTKRVECSSCHNPHVYYGAGLSGSTRADFTTDLEEPLVVTAAQSARTPFLNVSNVGSNLCLGCHIK